MVFPVIQHFYHTAMFHTKSIVQDKLGLKANLTVSERVQKVTEIYIALTERSALFLCLSSQCGLTERQIKVQADEAAGRQGVISYLVWKLSMDRSTCRESEARGQIEMTLIMLNTGSNVLLVSDEKMSVTLKPKKVDFT